MTGQEKGFKQPLAGWATRLKDLKQSVGLFVLGCPFSMASFMRLSTAPVYRTTKSWRGVKEICLWQQYSSLMIRNQYALYSVPLWKGTTMKSSKRLMAVLALSCIERDQRT